jgi:hypothetical protein
MKKRIICKTLVVAVIVLFLGVGIQPAIATVNPKEEIIDVEQKDYLFQTIIDIANNPDVKELLEQYKYDLFMVDVDRSIIRKTFFRNPRAIISSVFMKPSMSIEYLNFAYENGVKIINILGEDHVYKIVESIEVTNPQIFDDISNIISNDESLSNYIEILKNINKELNQNPPLFILPVTCGIFMALFLFIFAINNIFFGYGDVSLVTVLRIFPLGILDNLFLIIQDILYFLQEIFLFGVIIFCWPF